MVKRLDIQTLIKVGGGSNPNSLFLLNKIFFIRRHDKADTIIVTAQMQKRSCKIPMTFASGRRKTGLRYH